MREGSNMLGRLRKSAQGGIAAAKRWIRAAPPREPVIGLALGGGFARGIAHIGVLRVLEREGIPVHMTAGVSAGSMVAAALASGAASDDIEAVARTMRFRDVARWTVSRLGLARSDCMAAFLLRLLKEYRFERMRIPLAVVATDLCSGKAVAFKDHGDVLLPIRASCSYPGLYQPVRHQGRFLVDGAMSMEIPALALRQMGATHVISVSLPCPPACPDPRNMLAVVNRCFQIMQHRMERDWRRYSDVVIEPEVNNVSWDAFEKCDDVIAAGEAAARIVLPRLRKLLAIETAAAPVLPPSATALEGLTWERLGS
jgi:NTE family protein